MIFIRLQKESRSLPGQIRSNCNYSCKLHWNRLYLCPVDYSFHRCFIPGRTGIEVSRTPATQTISGWKCIHTTIMDEESTWCRNDVLSVLIIFHVAIGLCNINTYETDPGSNLGYIKQPGVTVGWGMRTQNTRFLKNIFNTFII